MSQPKQYSAKTGCFIIATICISIAALALWAFSVIWPANDCSETSEAVAFARSLSQERLEKLYNDMERISNDPSYPRERLTVLNLEEGEIFPEPFSDINAVKIRPGEANIMLEGCFDHYVYLHFEGYGSRKEYEPHRKIVLSWGEWEPEAGTQVLWQEEELEPGELVNASAPAGKSEKHLHD